MIIIVQARTGSTRLPNKVNLPFVRGKRVLRFLLNRLSMTDTVIAAPRCDAKRFVSYERDYRVYYEADESDVLTRFYTAVLKERCIDREDVIVRITGDCPLVDTVGDTLLQMESKLHGKQLDYISNCHPTRYVPSGFDIEMFTFKALEEAYNEAKDPSDREHVTPYIWREMKSASVKLPKIADASNIQNLKLSIDTKADYERVRFLARKLYKEYGYSFELSNVLDYAEKYALELAAIEAQHENQT